MSDFFHQHSMFFNGTTTKQNIAPRNVNLPTASLQLLQRPLKCPNNLCLPIRREYTGSLPTKNMLEPLCGKTIERTSPKIEQWINRKPMVYRDDKLPIDIGSMGRLYIYLYIWLIFVNPMVSLKECNKKNIFFRIPDTAANHFREIPVWTYFGRLPTPPKTCLLTSQTCRIFRFLFGFSFGE